MRLLIALLAAIALLATTAVASADTPSPTPAGSTINVRFLRDGMPATITYIGYRPDVYADGERCNFGIFPADAHAETSDHFSHAWPLEGRHAQGRCKGGPPTNIRVVFEIFTGQGSDLRFEWLISEFTWNGGDAWGELDVDAGAPAPSPTPTPVGQTPSPSPLVQTTITLHFVRAGQPVEADWILPTFVFVDGERCMIRNTTDVGFGRGTTYELKWPRPQTANERICEAGPPKTLSWTLLTYTPSPLVISPVVEWVGQDVDVYIDADTGQPIALASPSPTPQPDPSEVTFRFVRDGIPVLIPTPALTVEIFLGEQACSAVSFDGLPRANPAWARPRSV